MEWQTREIARWRAPGERADNRGGNGDGEGGTIKSTRDQRIEDRAQAMLGCAVRGVAPPGLEREIGLHLRSRVLGRLRR